MGHGEKKAYYCCMNIRTISSLSALGLLMLAMAAFGVGWGSAYAHYHVGSSMMVNKSGKSVVVVSLDGFRYAEGFERRRSRLPECAYTMLTVAIVDLVEHEGRRQTSATALELGHTEAGVFHGVEWFRPCVPSLRFRTSHSDTAVSS